MFKVFNVFLSVRCSNEFQITSLLAVYSMLGRGSIASASGIAISSALEFREDRDLIENP